MATERLKPYHLITLPAAQSARQSEFAQIDTDVPPRGPARTTEHTELFSILEALKCEGALPIGYPAVVIHRDKPDFLIDPVDGKTIGVEVVEAVSETAAKLDAERSRAPDSPGTTWARNDEPGKRAPKAKEIKKILAAEKLNDSDVSLRGGDGFAGDGASIWVGAMLHPVQGKLKVCRKEGFQCLARNWLLVVDNWEMGTSNQPKADQLLLERLQCLGAFEVFDLVLILDGHELAVFSSTTATRHPR